MDPIIVRIAQAIIDDSFTNDALQTLKKIDDKGRLYSIRFDGDYAFFQKKFVERILSKFGCSAFVAKNKNGEILFARNLDIPHFNKNNKLTGLNFLGENIIKNKYNSLYLSDGFYLSEMEDVFLDRFYEKDEKYLKYLFFIPSLCMDGMNEKGIACTVLFLDVKDGEQPTHQKNPRRKSVIIIELLKAILDTCSSIEEAISLAKKVNMNAINEEDYHLFIADANGKSAVFEWRYNTFTVTDTNIATNFYVGYDDACDSYYKGELKEKFTATNSKHKKYRYGYGHGYERFNCIVDYLEDKYVNGFPTISEYEAMTLLKKVSQQYNGEITSYTQYSAVYNLTKLETQVCVNMNYDNIYKFKLTSK